MKNDLKYFRMLESAGFNKKQAEVSLKVIEGAMNNNVATQFNLLEVQTVLEKDIRQVKTLLRQEIQDVRAELKQDIQSVHVELKQDIQNVHAELKQDIQNVHAELKQDIYSMSNKLITITAAMITALSGLVVLLKFAF